MAVNNSGMTPYDLTKSEDCKRTLLDAREGVIPVGIHATKPGDIESFSSNKFDSSPPPSCQNHHDNVPSPPNSELLRSWDLIGQFITIAMYVHIILFQNPALENKATRQHLVLVISSRTLNHMKEISHLKNSNTRISFIKIICILIYFEMLSSVHCDLLLWPVCASWSG